MADTPQCAGHANAAQASVGSGRALTPAPPPPGPSPSHPSGGAPQPCRCRFSTAGPSSTGGPSPTPVGCKTGGLWPDGAGPRARSGNHGRPLRSRVRTARAGGPRGPGHGGGSRGVSASGARRAGGRADSQAMRGSASGPSPCHRPALEGTLERDAGHGLAGPRRRTAVPQVGPPGAGSQASCLRLSAVPGRPAPRASIAR